ncbi:MAG TPA: NAD(+) diphosphatase, partial [Thermoanaerobaculia bacterium]
EARFLGEGDEPLFSLAVPDETVERLTAEGKAQLRTWRELVGEHHIDDAALAAHAIALERWHERSRYCGACGAPTAPTEGGNSRTCSAEGCAVRVFPRTDPVVIAVISNGRRCLLGRHNRARSSAFFTALAGFVEPGESAEDAVRREVFEEAGVRVNAVRYFGSQPWPFPHSLMLGFFGETDDTEIDVDREELIEARWFTPEEILGGSLSIPPRYAIATQLIVAWAEAQGGGGIDVDE